MKHKVVVTADAAGNVVVPSENSPEWGHIRVEQTRMEVDENGFARKKSVSALITGLIPDLKGFKFHAGQEIDGSVIWKESLKPFNKKNPERDYKIAGETEIVCCVNGAPIYRKSFYTENSSAEDILVAHTNSEDIKAAFAGLKKADKSIDKL